MSKDGTNKIVSLESVKLLNIFPKELNLGPNLILL